LVIEDKSRNKVSSSHFGDETADTTADTVPFVATHGARHIKVEHDCEVLYAYLQEGVVFLAQENSVALIAVDSHHPDVALDTQPDLNLVKDAADFRGVNIVILSILSTSSS
jgi:hypothetical protein